MESAMAFVISAAPVWWVTGFSIFIFHAVVLWGTLHMLVQCAVAGRALQIPKLLSVFAVFLLIYAFSIFANAGSNASERTFASLNNYAMVLMGLLIMLVTYHCDFRLLLDKTLNASRIFCIGSGLMGLAVLLIWMKSGEFQWNSMLGQKMPSLLNYPYFYSLMTAIPVLMDDFAGLTIPRIALFSQAPTGTGGLMVLFLPLMMAWYVLHGRKRLEYAAVIALSLFTLFFSLSRSAVFGLIGGWLMVFVLDRNKKLFFILLIAAVFVLASGLLDPTIDWLLNSRKSSTVGRMEVYEDAFRIVTRENLWTGMGARLRDDFTMRAIGSHALYVEIFFVTGLLGFAAFTAFQFWVMLAWYGQRKLLETGRDRTVWKYLGISLISTNIWLLTDTFFAMPLMAYGYFLLTGFIFAFGRELKQASLRDSPGLTSAGQARSG